MLHNFRWKMQQKLSILYKTRKNLLCRTKMKTYCSNNEMIPRSNDRFFRNIFSFKSSILCVCCFSSLSNKVYDKSNSFNDYILVWIQ